MQQAAMSVVSWVMVTSYALTQLAAGVAGLAEAFGEFWATIGMGVAFLAGFTLPLSFGAFWCALAVWGWPWPAALLFAAPGLVVLVPGVARVVMGGAGRRVAG
jgi:hypothetical protein